MSQNSIVDPYGDAAFKALLVKYSRASAYEVDQDALCLYLEKYLKHLNTEAIVVETEYTDKDFLEDYSAYYVRCFSPYKRICTRLHFFSVPFDDRQLDGLLEGRNEDIDISKLAESYLGFIVIKDLPKAFIGRSCLKIWDNNPKTRYFPIKRKYETHLYGIPLELKTIAFQAQDQVAAACATNALWFAFQQTGILFHHKIPSPVEITKSATKYSLPQTRVLPSKYLSLEQMAQAVRDVSLEPHTVKTAGNIMLTKLNIYAYLKAKLPVILGVILMDTSDPKHFSILNGGGHTISVLGYSHPGTMPKKDFLGLYLYAGGIDKVYAHDDGVGPFARMEFTTKETEDDEGNPFSLECLTTGWRSKAGSFDKIVACPLFVLVPVYHKIRIPYQIVEENVRVFNTLVEFTRSKSQNYLIPEHLVWDINLTTINDLKLDLIDEPEPSGTICREILLRPLPRFIWRATAYCAGKRHFDLLFDATDIELGRQYLLPIVYDNTIPELLSNIEIDHLITNEMRLHPAWRIYEHFHETKYNLPSK